MRLACSAARRVVFPRFSRGYKKVGGLVEWVAHEVVKAHENRATDRFFVKNSSETFVRLGGPLDSTWRHKLPKSVDNADDDFNRL
jgi:hypothetical protein